MIPLQAAHPKNCEKGLLPALTHHSRAGWLFGLLQLGRGQLLEGLRQSPSPNNLTLLFR